MMLLRLTLTVVFLNMGYAAFSQKIGNVIAQRSGPSFIIHYSLLNENSDNQVQISLYSSIDGFMRPLTNLTGDVGDSVTEGPDKQIIWRPDKESKRYKKGFMFEVRSKSPHSLIQLNNITAGRIFKRRKKYLFSWTSTKKIDRIDIQILMDDKTVWNQEAIENKEKYELRMPGSLKAGGGYRLKLSDSNNSNYVAYSPLFEIKRRIPLSLKIIGATGIGIVTLLLSRNTVLEPGQFPSPPTSPH